MTIDEFKPNATNRFVEDVPGKMFARVRLGEAEKSLAAIWLSTYLGRVRSRHAGNFSRRQRGLDPLSPS